MTTLILAGLTAVFLLGSLYFLTAATGPWWTTDFMRNLERVSTTPIKPDIDERTYRMLCLKLSFTFFATSLAMACLTVYSLGKMLKGDL